MPDSQYEHADNNIKEIVKEKYGQAALRVLTTAAAVAAARRRPTDCPAIRSPRTFTMRRRPGDSRRGDAGVAGLRQSDGAGETEPGETVLDLGSGGGIDVLLSARRVGPTGKAYGLDMTDEMLALANENKRKAGVENVEFLKGEIENIPLPDNSVDVIISNCVINLSADKDRVLREAFRVLKPGGRFAVSDVVTRGEMLPRSGRACCCGSVASPALSKKTNIAASWPPPDLNKSRSSRREFIAWKTPASFSPASGVDVDAIAAQVDGKFMSAFVRAVKPERTQEACCGPACCN